MKILTLFDKQGMPIWLSLALASSILLLLFILIHNQKPKDMHRSRITRTVVGIVTDPSSTRTLSSMTHEEFTHLRLAVLAAHSEAETYCLMPDDILLETIESNRRACCHIGMEIPPCELPEVSLMREFFAGRAEYCLAFLARMGEKPSSRIKGITPEEFMHLVASIQAGCREATIGLAFPESLVAEAFRHAGRIRAGLGLPFVHPYQRYEPGYHAFFSRRLKVLEAVLLRINQPYLGIGYAEGPEFAIFA